MQRTESVDRLVNVEEIAAVLGVPTSWVCMHTAAGTIPHVRVGRYVRFRVGDVLDWLAARAS